MQNYLVIQPVYIYFEKTGDKISSWKSNALSDEETIPQRLLINLLQRQYMIMQE